MAIIKPEEMDQNVAQAPTLGRQVGSISQGGGMQPQRRNVSQRGSGFTNLQQYVTANENNANPELVRQRTQQAGTGLQQAQTGFENVAQQARTGLQGIQGVNTFVQGVLADPTKAAADKANLQRFQALRTGQTAIANPTDVLQPFTQAQAGFESQREQLAGGLRTDTTGTGLQNYIRSQRANPSLATQGENVLDRFLTESTTAGKTALQQAQERAGQIQATQLPGISGEVDALRQQVEPLQFRTQQAIQSGIMAPVTQEQDYINNLNKLYIAQQVGLGAAFQPNLISLQNMGGVDALAVPDLTYIKPEDLGTATQSNIDTAKTEYDRYNNFINQRDSIDNSIRENQRELNKANKSIVDMYDIGGAIRKAQVEEQLRGNIENLQKQKENVFKQSSGIDVSKVPVYQEYVNRLGKTRQQLLEEYDKPRLARINALSQLSGSSFQDLLNRGVS
jgi:flagellar biosynthesis chaperone FliJ